MEKQVQVKWQWNDETEEWEQVEVDMTARVTGEWTRDEQGRWVGWWEVEW